MVNTWPFSACKALFACGDTCQWELEIETILEMYILCMAGVQGSLLDHEQVAMSSYIALYDQEHETI
jgi:hypothetical protein